MRVRVNTSSITDPKITQGITALTNGHEYAVLEISAPFKMATSFRVEFIEGGLRQSALFDTRVFTVISHSLPPTWRYFQLESGSFSLCPESWNKSVFGRPTTTGTRKQSRCTSTSGRRSCLIHRSAIAGRTRPGPRACRPVMTAGPHAHRTHRVTRTERICKDSKRACTRPSVPTSPRFTGSTTEGKSNHSDSSTR